MKEVLPLDQVAVVVDRSDNVAVAKKFLAAGLILSLNGRPIVLKKSVPAGHRFALRAIPAGAFVRQYGQPFAISRGIEEGELVSRENIEGQIPGRQASLASQNEPPSYFPEFCQPVWQGYRRADGQVGTRNFILIAPTSMCASTEAFQISVQAELLLYDPEKYPNVSGVTAIPHTRGCGCPDGTPVEMVLKILSRYIEHPNVYGALVLELGCEKTNLNALHRFLGGLHDKKPIKTLSIQGCGGTKATIKKGLDVVGEWLEDANRCLRQSVGANELILGVKCGGSDGFSGITANPALGYAADLLIRHRGTVLFTEVPEIYGAEHLLAARAKDPEVGQKVLEAVQWFRAYVGTFGHDLDENPSAGNIAGGLVNIALKSLGAIAKAGTSRLEGVIGYGDLPPGKGLYLMQGPGYDQESTPGLVASGAQIVAFTTGRGTTIGNAIAPVLKIASNTETFRRMENDLDINAGGILDGEETIEQVGERIFQAILNVASGQWTKAEINGHREFGLWTVEGVSL
ncbi:MAG: altronate dehydratase family protein [Armatimonadetes bacterium]|nr:altronate dehydratase family protein [Armatimonadota bacterium]MDW8121566.1 altronate dehydratase family protein [Armatimonadota bacterium]